MHQATLGTSRLLARPGEGRLWLLDASAAALWDLHQAGWGPAPLAGLLAERFALAPTAASDYVNRLQAQWRAEGLLAGAPAAASPRAPFAALPTFPPAAAVPAVAGA